MFTCLDLFFLKKGHETANLIVFIAYTQVSSFKGIPSLNSVSGKESLLSGKQTELLRWILNPKTFTLQHRSLSEVI